MADDLISKLPDVLIQQILSLLPMDQAVRTSILSKRWEFLWTSFPNLVFDLYDEEDNEFVDRALFLRESKIKKFSISFEHEAGPNEVFDCLIHLRRWVTDIVRLHVEDLHLDFCGREFHGSLEFPHCLFTCSSLISFSLRTWVKFRIPPSTNLSNLKNLVLEYFHFDDAESVENLFQGCPMLETARLLDCSFHCDSRISAPKLYKLVLVEPGESTDICHDIMIFGPSLKFFHFFGEFINSYCLNNQPSLDEAEISVDRQYDIAESEWEGFVCRFYKLLKGFPLVKKLSLSSEALEALGYQGNLLAEVPFFNNLSILSFKGHDTIGLDLEDNDDNAYYIGDQYVGLMRILQKSPCLECLRFETGIILSAHYEEYERTLNLVSPCYYLSRLKTLEILFKKNDDYPKLFMNTAKILLERASVLHKFILYASKFSVVSPMDKEKLIERLNELPRASKVCQFEFSDFEMKSV